MAGRRYVMTIADDDDVSSAAVAVAPAAEQQRASKRSRKQGASAAAAAGEEELVVDPDFEFEAGAGRGALGAPDDFDTIPDQILKSQAGFQATSVDDKIAVQLRKRSLGFAGGDNAGGDSDASGSGSGLGSGSGSASEADSAASPAPAPAPAPAPGTEPEVDPLRALSDSEGDDDTEGEEDGDGMDESADEGAAAAAPQFFSDTPAPDEGVTSFERLNLSRPLLKAVSKLGFVQPTPIQARTIPLALLGRDICACAATGSGKTAAFMLPVLERLLFRPKKIPQTRILILLPTRELALQVCDMAQRLAQYTDITFGLSVGGMSLKVQEQELRKRPDVVVATPGRLVDHIQNTHSFDLETIEVLILDEADRLLEIGFTEELDMIIRNCARTRTTMLFSATMTDEVEDLIKLSLHEPVRLFVNKNTQVTDNLVQEFVRIRSHREEDREAIVVSLCKRVYKSRVLVFVRSKKFAHRLRIVLGLVGLKAGELHGSLTQTQRMEALESFKQAEVDFLVCTDLAARGLDVPKVATVVNASMPNSLKQYIHRVGRTARAGEAGRAVSLVGDLERKMLRDLAKGGLANMKTRQVSPDVIAKFKKAIGSLAADIDAIMKAESEEKELKQAEMEVLRAQNIIDHQAEIMARPARTWIQTAAQKAQSKELSRKAHEGEEVSLPSESQKKAALLPLSVAEAKQKLGRPKQQKRKHDGIDPEVKYIVRQTKRAKKAKRMHVFNDGPQSRKEKAEAARQGPKDGKGKGKKGKRKKSGVATEVVNTSKKAQKAASQRPSSGPRPAPRPQTSGGKRKSGSKAKFKRH